MRFSVASLTPEHSRLAAFLQQKLEHAKRLSLQLGAQKLFSVANVILGGSDGFFLQPKAQKRLSTVV
jgi:hypothetical protein